MNRPTFIKDAAEKILSHRNTDGTGWDSTYDENGNRLSYRHTDGIGWDSTYDEDGNELSRRYTDGTGYDCTYDENGNQPSFTEIKPKLNQN